MRAVVVILVMLLSFSAKAADIGGRIKLDAIGYDSGNDSVDSTLGYQRSSELAGQLRLETTQRKHQWTINAAWQLDARYGRAVKRDHAVAKSYPSLSYVNSDNSYWDLDDTISDSGNRQAVQRLDRLNIGYARGALVGRMGRQALTWGSGLVFHPMDLVNPFQPVATDTTYKRGTDMVYGQWLLDDGSDIQFVFVPHKQRNSVDSDAGKNTYAVFANLIDETLQWTVLLARDRDDSVLGIGVSGPLSGSVWNIEVIPTYLDDETTKTSALMNISGAATFLKRNLTTFAELYHNGFGETGNDYTVAQLNSDLTTRLDRGQLFVTGRDYVSAGATWEWTPLLQLMPTVIVNVHDQSTLFDVQLTRSVSNNITLKGGLRIPLGDKGSEFSGLELSPSAKLYLANSTQGFFRVDMYF